MERDNIRHKAMSRRTALLVGGKLGLSALLVGRMYYLQVVQSGQYQMLAEENRINMRLLPPSRGRILDRFGVPVAENRQNFRVLLVPEQTDSVEDTLARLGELIALDEESARRVLREVQRQRKFVPVTVAENLTWDSFARVNAHQHRLPAVQPEVGETRHYPFGEDLAHVVGYVGAVSEKELTGEPLLELPGFRIGKSGTERTFDLLLRGKAGASQVEVNAYGRVIRELNRRPGDPGQDLTLTIDSALQRFATQRVAQESASAVVMEVHGGDVLALVSSPGFDPNAFNVGLSGRDWQALISDPRKPLINKAIAGQYPPGSTFKMLVAMAALESGAMSAGQRVFCNGAVRLGNHTFHCWRWRYGGHGHVNMREAIEQSCDIYFYEAARKLGVDRIAEMARRFGLGAPVDIGLSGEQGGFVPTKDWKRAVKGTSWQQGETLITGIGQGYLLTTPLQLAVMTARIANGGHAVQPRLTHQPLPGSEGRQPAGQEPGQAEAAASHGFPPLGVSAAALKVVIEGMHDVVNGRKGTARKAQLAGEASMAGKTGTAQVRRISRSERAAGVRKNEDKPWEERDHGLFVGFAPAAAPRYAVSVVLEHGGSGTNAAMVAKDIMGEVLRRDPMNREAPQAAGPSGPQSERG